MWPGDPTWRFSSPRGWHSSWKTHSWGNFAFQAGSLGRAWRTHGHVPCCDSISGNNVTAARNLRPVDGNETFSSGQVCVWARIIRGGNLSRFADLAKPTPSMLLSLSSSLLNLVTPSYHPRMALDSPPHMAQFYWSCFVNRRLLILLHGLLWLENYLSSCLPTLMFLTQLLASIRSHVVLNQK